MMRIGHVHLSRSSVEALIETSAGGYDLIYIDPPFGLQREFRMVEADGTKKSFQDSWSSYDDYIAWLSTIIEGLFGLLNKDGWLYSHNNFEGNALALASVNPSVRRAFYTNIAWVRSHPKNNISVGWGNIVDSIMVLRKGKPYFEVEYGDLDPTYAANSFNNEDERGRYALAPATGEKSRPGHSYTYGGMTPTFGWRYPEEKTRELDEQGLIHFGKNKPYKKIYLHESKGPPVQNIWTDIHNLTRTERNKRKYPTQKPIALLERIVRTSCPPGGRVLDPFCGSGTTAIATLRVGGGRQCDTYDVSEEAVAIAKSAIEDEVEEPIVKPPPNPPEDEGSNDPGSNEPDEGGTVVDTGKRKGKGGNESKDPKGNLKAHEDYKKKYGKNTKKCVGILHHDGDEIDVAEFRQHKSNPEGLQPRCDRCNQIYHASSTGGQKLKAPLMAYVIQEESKGRKGWRKKFPKSVVKDLEEALKVWNEGCAIKGCTVKAKHGNFRKTVKALGSQWKGDDKGKKGADLKYDGDTFRVPQKIADRAKAKEVLDELCPDGTLDFWQELFPDDTVRDSAEENAYEDGEIDELPEYPISHTQWRSGGNIKDTVQGHNIPSFNKLLDIDYPELHTANSDSRPYGFVCEGDRKKSREFRRKELKKGETLGHYPAPLRWLGKDDPVNHISQDAKENSDDKDRLDHLYALAVKDPEAAGNCVSWQIRDLVVKLGKEKVTLAEFRTQIHAAVTDYFAGLYRDHEQGGRRIHDDINRADPGQTAKIYGRREEKLLAWLKNENKRGRFKHSQPEND